MKNSRLKDINDFLLYYKKLYQQNPNLMIHSKDTFYNSLCTFKLSHPWENIKIFHESFVSYFKNISNINVFVADNWQYFCQFVNSDSKLNLDRLKLYISMDKNNIYEASKELFEYLARNNIKHLSKIGSEVRTDDIVIRLDNFDDYKKVKDFVSKSKCFKNGKNQLNPFLLTDDIIGYAYDGRLSYNNTVSIYLASYFQYVRENNLLNEVSAIHFYNYLRNMYSKVFQTGELLNEYIKKFNIHSVDLLINYEQVTKTLIASIQTADKSLDMDLLKQLDDEFNNKEIIARKKQYFKRLINQVVSNNNEINNYSNSSWLMKYNGIVPNNDLFNDIRNNIYKINIENIDKSYYINMWFCYLVNNYSNVNAVKSNINLSLEGNIRAITRTNNLRYIFYKYITPNDIRIEINRLSDGKGLDFLISNILNSNSKQNSKSR